MSCVCHRWDFVWNVRCAKLEGDVCIVLIGSRNLWKYLRDDFIAIYACLCFIQIQPTLSRNGGFVASVSIAKATDEPLSARSRT